MIADTGVGGLKAQFTLFHVNEINICCSGAADFIVPNRRGNSKKLALNSRES